jgi:hypothetical protein
MEKIKLENRFYSQDELDQMLYDEKITGLDYVTHQSEENTAKFKEYCTRLDVPENEESAGNYMNYLLREEERSHTVGLD